MEVFVERCGRLTWRDVEALVAAYERLGASAGQIPASAERLVQHCRRANRAGLVAAAAEEAVARARLSSGWTDGAPWPILRWTAFAIAASDVAAGEAIVVMDPWRSAVGDHDRDRVRRRRLPTLVIPGLIMCVALLLVALGLAPLAAIVLVGAGWLALLGFPLGRPAQ